MDNNVADCFHGRLDRQAAEDRLNQTGRPGSFLLRESERKSGSYVLSYLGRNGINHFRITHSFGSYFIGGRQFESLSDLITHYSAISNLYTDERLAFPVPPPEPVEAKERVFISILPYTKLAQSDELSFKKGDVFILQNDLGDGWLWCRDVKTGESGLIFSQLVEELDEGIDPNEVFPWFHARLSKADAVDKLAQAGPGSFLVRPSDNSPGNYTLFYHVGTTVQRFLIVKNSESRYLMGGKYFDSLGQIVELYQREPIMEGHVLQFPVTTTMSRADQLSESTLSSSMRALEVREKPQDIYNTVKLSREAAKLKQSNELKGWLMLKKGDILKKWKNYYFVLNSRDRQLYYYEKPQQTKPKGLIDLSYSYVYEVDESLFDWPQCFQVVEKCLPCFGNNFYFRCDDDNLTYNRWIQEIKCFTASNQTNKMSVGSTKVKRPDATFDISRRYVSAGSYSEKRSLYLHLIEAHSLKTSQPCFVIAYEQDIKIAKTNTKSSPSALFTDDGHFSFENLPSDIKVVTILMQQIGKKQKASTSLPQFSIDLNSLSVDGENFDRWFKFHVGNSSEVLGCLRMRVTYCTDLIMSLPEYEALEDLVCDKNVEVLSILNQFCHRDHIALARALINIFNRKKTSSRILTKLVERDISSEQDSALLFRTSSLTTALIESYMRLTCQAVLTKCLRFPVRKLLDDKICCELNPAKLDSHNVSQKACENFETLLEVLDELVSDIYDSVHCYPMQIRYLLAYMQTLVKQRWPQEPLARTRVVSGFLLLRLICPTILTPKQFNLINETPSENAIRNLTLVAKCLQSLANLTETSKVSVGGELFMSTNSS
jgi:Ras GTPase-activating protein 1